MSETSHKIKGRVKEAVGQRLDQRGRGARNRQGDGCCKEARETNTECKATESSAHPLLHAPDGNSQESMVRPRPA
jgi:hypothetical protein